MLRRDLLRRFGRVAGAAGLAALLVPPRAWADPIAPMAPASGSAGPSSAPAAAELRAFWVDAFHDGFKTPAQVDALLAFARAANLNTLFVQVRRRGDAYYSRSLEPRAEDPALAPDFDPLSYLLTNAHVSPPIQVHAWIATLPVWGHRDRAPLDPRHVLNLHGTDPSDPNTWLMLRDDGEAWAGTDPAGMYYLDPGHPDAAAYTLSIAVSLADTYPLDGIHLDQVRYYEGQPGRWGYNPTSVTRFNRSVGQPTDAVPAADDPAWMAWRRDQVSALVRSVYLEVKALRPSIAVTAAVVAWGKAPEPPRGWEGTAAFTTVFQDWQRWLEDGVIDYAVPMDYYRELGQGDLFDAWAGWQVAHQGSRAVAVGLGSYLNSPSDALSQALRSRDLHPLGLAWYSYAEPLSAQDSDPQAAALPLLQSLYPTPAEPPALAFRQGGSSGGLLVDARREGLRVAVDGPTSASWTTDGLGRAGSARLPAGTYRVQVTRSDGVAESQLVAVGAGSVAVVRVGG